MLIISAAALFSFLRDAVGPGPTTSRTLMREVIETRYVFLLVVKICSCVVGPACLSRPRARDDFVLGAGSSCAPT